MAQNATREAARSGRVVGVVLPTVLAAGIGSGSMLALVLSGSVAIGGLGALAPDRAATGALPRVQAPAEVSAPAAAPARRPAARPTGSPSTTGPDAVAPDAPTAPVVVVRPRTTSAPATAAPPGNRPLPPAAEPVTPPPATPPAPEPPAEPPVPVTTPPVAGGTDGGTDDDTDDDDHEHGNGRHNGHQARRCADHGRSRQQQADTRCNGPVTQPGQHDRTDRAPAAQQRSTSGSDNRSAVPSDDAQD